MKMNENIKVKLLKSFKDWRTDRAKAINKSIRLMEKAKTVEEFMVLKREIMLDTTDLPLGSSNCYFCYKQAGKNGNLRCKTCAYGKLHGLCNSGKDDYDRLCDAEGSVGDAIYRYYPVDEKYSKR